MNSLIRFGIIDIGSNSIRLVIYEQMENRAYRVIDESKEAARLSQYVDKDHCIPTKKISHVVDALIHFKLLCKMNKTELIRTTATAAIRNAANTKEIIHFLEEGTGLKIEILSGEDEARLGYIGTLNSLSENNGFLLDIGGGSTELSLVKNRKIVYSHSFPFGAVNTSRNFPGLDKDPNQQTHQIRNMIQKALLKFPWTKKHQGLPLIGLGGTFRNVCKINQRLKQYSLSEAHNYEMSNKDVNQLLEIIKGLSITELKRLDGLSKDRADIILPGICILKTIADHVASSHYIISGSGLRDGLSYEMMYPKKPLFENVLEHSIHNLLLLYPSTPLTHLNQVNRISLQLFDHIHGLSKIPNDHRSYLHVASLLYRIGISVNYYNYHLHTFYLILNSRIGGLTHREKLLCALIASYKSKTSCKKLYMDHRDILSLEDYHCAIYLGALLNVAISLDRSQTQPISSLSIKLNKKKLDLHALCKHNATIELRELENVSNEFSKIWGMKPQLSYSISK